MLLAGTSYAQITAKLSTFSFVWVPCGHDPPRTYDTPTQCRFNVGHERERHA